MIKTYTEMCSYPTFEGRLRYLRLASQVGDATFGYDRYLNQVLYHSEFWKRVRRDVIIRDDGCDLGIHDREIFGKILIHHINPITLYDIEQRKASVFDLENLICTSHETHQAIHFGDERKVIQLPIIRKKGDTKLW